MARLLAAGALPRAATGLVLRHVRLMKQGHVGMVIGMANMQKVTITLPTQAVEAIRELVTEGKAETISGFVQHAVQTSLDDVTGWGTMLAKALEETGGPMTAEERAWADEVLGHGNSKGAA